MNTSRRRLIKNLLLAGAGIYLVRCNNSDEPAVIERIDEPTDTIPEVIEKVEKIEKTENVLYFYSRDERFSELNTFFNSDIPTSPKVIALPSNTAGVSEAIQFARIEGLKVSVRSGGHSFEGFSCKDDGMVIHLGEFKKMDWIDDSTLKVEAGVLLQEIYDEILPKKRILPAGSCGTVGIGGLTLGGGYGFFARKYGLTCDNLLSITLVDAQGEIHELSSDEDLWAFKGGGNGNFGVVTDFTFQTHALPSHFSNKKFRAYQLDVSRAKELLQQWFEATKNISEDIFSAFVLNGKTLTILVTYYAENPVGLDELTNILTPITDKQTSYKTEDIATHLTFYYGAKKPLPFKNASAGYYNSFVDIENCIDVVLEKVITSHGMLYQINTLGGKINDPELAEKSSYPHRTWNYLSELQCYWAENTPEKGEKLKTDFAEIQEVFYQNGNTTQYRNYPFLGFKDWETAYYGENYPRLQEIKTKFDPDNLFEYEQGIKDK